jgi:hypothetical protein
VVFKQWLEENGASFDKIEYPVAFHHGGFLVGIAAKEDIEPGTRVIDLPQNLAYHRINVLRSEIGDIVKNHPEVFDKHQEIDFAIVLYTFHEKLKGDKSFWTPLYNIINLTHLPCFWEGDLVKEF